MKLCIAVLAAAAMHAQDLMPIPAKLELGSGHLKIGPTLTVAIAGSPDERVAAAAKRLSVHRATPATATLLIHCEHAGNKVQTLGEDESYRLEVTTTQARLTAPNPLGVIRGIETFRQLVASGAPVVTIEDAPRFPWRGLHMDVSRHWMPLSVVLRNLDGMAAVKLNVFHWHLSDDQGFRIESKIYPKLQQLGSDGHYYTQAQARHVIAYARDRGIRVVPEFDVPAHASAWLVGYPELGSAPGPYEIGRHWGIFEPTLDPTRESVYTFLDRFIGEMAALFPDEYFHIGGDEVNGKQWDSNRQIQAFMRAHNLADNQALQAYFNKRIQAIVTKHGKRMEGWDEILDPGLPKDIVIQSWRGLKSLDDAAQMGYDGILSTPYYLDAMKSAGEYYAADLPSGKPKILGGEICAWAEFLTPENIDSRIWPRSAAIAERFWSPQSVQDPASMYLRLAATSRELERLDLHVFPSFSEPLKTLADVVTPVRLGLRQRARKYTQQTPLNRLCDTAAPESERARLFGVAVDQFLAGQHDQAKDLRHWLTVWRDSNAKLKPHLTGINAELAPVSANLAGVGSIGLQALDAIAAGRRPPDTWIQQQRAYLDAAKKPQAELTLQVVAPVQKLLEAVPR